MRRLSAAPIIVLVFITVSLAQDDLPTFRAKAASTFVWGEDNNVGAISSSVLDPVTGNTFQKLIHNGIDVTSRAGFERIRIARTGELLNFTTTIVNDTSSALSVRYGGSSVDGRAMAPLSVVSTKNEIDKINRKASWELAKMQCFSNGFLTPQSYFFTNSTSQTFRVAPKSAITISLVTKDPRNYSMRCSVEGCYPTGTMRFAVTIDTTDFVFVWPGRSMMNCGK